jgi:hypothetical protein
MKKKVVTFDKLYVWMKVKTMEKVQMYLIDVTRKNRQLKEKNGYYELL